MLLEEVVVHNFGAYRGRHTIALSPPAPDKPVILVGGLNGTGKTTLLDALQLALYGNLARCASRGSLNYNEFLQRSINRTVPPSEGAALELQFRHTAEGSEHSYRIHRYWSSTPSGVREKVDILLDGKNDRVLADSWSEHVQDFLPSSISHLFFFDGEKIEALADLDNSRQILATAIHSLLGLDLVDRLGTDLLVLERRKLVALKSEPERARIDAIKQQLQMLQEQLTRLSEERAAAQNEFDRKQKLLTELELRFRSEGGDLFAQRNELEAKRSSLEKRASQIEVEMRDLAAGAAPLFLAPSLLAAIDVQADIEENSHRARTIDAFLLERDTKLLAKLRKLHIPKDLLSTVGQFLEKDRAMLVEKKEVKPYLNLEPDAHLILRSLRGPILQDTRARVHRLTQQHLELRGSLIDIDRQLAATPDRDAVSRLIEEREAAKLSLDKSGARLQMLDEQIDRLRREHQISEDRLTTELEKNVQQEFETDASARMVNHSSKVRATLAAFRTRVVQRHLTHIEGLILESFQQLLRKQSLVTRISIDPSDYTLHLNGWDGKNLPTERLSAGERQLLAVSTLWGLARASRRTLPSVIDTPLGRLDSTHRDHLVERYFPNVSHQVMLLSTDKEIDKHYYDKLKPKIGRSYRLDVEEPTGNARIEAGYFW
jgi:DNA sulfur modification protein DndD